MAIWNQVCNKRLTDLQDVVTKDWVAPNRLVTFLVSQILQINGKIQLNWLRWCGYWIYRLITYGCNVFPHVWRHQHSVIMHKPLPDVVQCCYTHAGFFSGCIWEGHAAICWWPQVSLPIMLAALYRWNILEYRVKHLSHTGGIVKKNCSTEQ